jgi:prepilin-type N-terminal cleavage/methylation domain-containing protein
MKTIGSLKTGRLISRTACRRGFTLIELLLVVAVITILMSMLGVVAPAIQERIDRTRCQKNLKMIHQVLMSYAEQNEGWFPQFSTSGLAISHPYRWTDGSRSELALWQAMSDVAQLKQIGGSAEVFFCPLHPDYGDHGNLAFNSWNEPRSQYSSHNQYHYYETNMGYYTTINKSIYNSSNRLTDGRIILRKFLSGQEDMPIFADILRISSTSQPHGWYHGGSSSDVNDRAYKGGGNTLFLGGHVVWKEWSELDEQASRPQYGCGTEDSSNAYYFWLGHAL